MRRRHNLEHLKDGIKLELLDLTHLEPGEEKTDAYDTRTSRLNGHRNGDS